MSDDQRTRRQMLRAVSVVGGAAAMLGAGATSVAAELTGHSVTDAQFDSSYQAPQDLATLATKPSPMRGITLDDFVATTTRVVRQVARHGPVILVGMSMGGATIGRVGSLVPHLLDRIVYMSAFCCVELPSCVDYMGTPEGSTSLLGDLPGAQHVASGRVGPGSVR